MNTNVLLNNPESGRRSTELRVPTVLYRPWEIRGIGGGVRMVKGIDEGLPESRQKKTEANGIVEQMPDSDEGVEAIMAALVETETDGNGTDLQSDEDGWTAVDRLLSSDYVSQERSKQSNRLNTLYKEYVSAESGKDDRTQNEVFMRIYKIFEKQIRAAIRKYRNLSNIHDDEDLLQDSYVALITALRNYRKRGRDVPSQAMKFSTYLQWCVTNTFQQDIGSKDKMVEILNEREEVVELMEYSKFIKVKKSLASHGFTFNTTVRVGYLEDMLYEPPFIPQESIEDGFIMIEARGDKEE